MDHQEVGRNLREELKGPERASEAGYGEMATL
jgi:hypothetical protein